MYMKCYDPDRGVYSRKSKKEEDEEELQTEKQMKNWSL